MSALPLLLRTAEIEAVAAVVLFSFPSTGRGGVTIVGGFKDDGGGVTGEGLADDDFFGATAAVEGIVGGFHKVDEGDLADGWLVTEFLEINLAKRGANPVEE